MIRRAREAVPVLAVATATAAASLAMSRTPEATSLTSRALRRPPITAPAPSTQAPAPTPEAVLEQPAGNPGVTQQQRGARVQGAVRPALPRSRGTVGWVQIPSIRTNAPVVAEGVDSKGNLITPTNAREVAWFDTGDFPGPERNAIMAGHINWSGATGSFARLSDVRPGDAVIVGMEGQVHTFHVTWVRMFDPKTAPLDDILGPTPVDSLTLVTCGGAFDARIHHYLSRWVVRAEAVSA